ncbi:MAG TPA: NAD-dependent deacylase [Thermoleophilaceae bacterium]|nr:NAD-dependent deacylase [Thermoleophilaceae bacterium]
MRARLTPSSQTERLAELLRGSERAVALTGAGVSVPSGIPDFRSPGTGLWENVNPMEVAHIDAFRADPDRFWAFYGERFAALHDRRPNPAHEALAELERRGLLRGVITQNIDRLHRAGGSRNVVEVHGSIEWSVCPVCGRRERLDGVLAQLRGGRSTPLCRSCRRPLKPDVVLFGELLPEEAMEEARRLAAEADLLLCVGSSLEVYPVAALPELTLGGGGSLAIVTQGPTSYDDRATVRLAGDVAEELEAVMKVLLSA